MFLKEKINGNVKGRACANGSKKRTYINKEDATSPTSFTEAVFLEDLIE